jgi:hypothetical protein
MERRFCTPSLLFTLLSVGGVVHAEDAGKEKDKETVDAEFLEFLGSFGEEDDGLLDYLASEDVSKDARPGKPDEQPKVNRDEP